MSNRDIILDTLRSEKREITIDELALLTGCTTRTIKRNLSRLCEDGEVTRYTYANGDFWAIREEPWGPKTSVPCLDEKDLKDMREYAEKGLNVHPNRVIEMIDEIRRLRRRMEEVE